MKEVVREESEGWRRGETERTPTWHAFSIWHSFPDAALFFSPCWAPPSDPSCRSPPPERDINGHAWYKAGTWAQMQACICSHLRSDPLGGGAYEQTCKCSFFFFFSWQERRQTLLHSRINTCIMVMGDVYDEAAVSAENRSSRWSAADRNAKPDLLDLEQLFARAHTHTDSPVCFQLPQINLLPPCPSEQRRRRAPSSSQSPGRSAYWRAGANATASCLIWIWILKHLPHYIFHYLINYSWNPQTSEGARMPSKHLDSPRTWFTVSPS